MKHKKTVTRECEETIATECDFCGGMKDARNGKWSPECRSSRWEDGGYRTDDASKLRLNCGWNFPDGGSGVEWDFDICPRCFETKIVPLALPNRQEPHEWDY